jgi:cysteine-rich repeat protein
VPCHGGPDADPALCGNGELDGGEPCDDGNDVDTDLCTSGCRIAACGDGFVRESVEECDDGGADPAGACNALCRSCGAPQDFTWPVTGACYRRRDAAGLGWSIANARCGMTGAHLAVYETVEGRATRWARRRRRRRGVGSALATRRGRASGSG